MFLYCFNRPFVSVLELHTEVVSFCIKMFDVSIENEVVYNTYLNILGESPLTERELNLAEVVVDKWKCYLCTSIRVCMKPLILL